MPTRRPTPPRTPRPATAMRSVVVPGTARAGRPQPALVTYQRPVKNRTNMAPGRVRRRVQKAPIRPSVSTRDQSQMSSSSKTMVIGRQMSTGQKSMVLTRANLQKLVFRWNGVKAFSGNGYYYMSNKQVDANTRALPCYLFDLTAVNNFSRGTIINSVPMLQLQQDVGGAMAFTQVSGLQADGTTTTTSLQVERQIFNAASGAGAVYPYLYGRALLESAVIKLNCWGATKAATKWYLSLVQFTDKDLAPTHAAYSADLAAATPKRTDLFQSLMKALTFNPISTTGGAFNKRLKVIKSMAFTLEPTQTIDQDGDPFVKTVTWSLKMNKLLDFVETALPLASSAAELDQANYAQPAGDQVRAQVKPTSRTYLMIRSTNYGVDATESNQFTPSFDLSMRMYYSVPQ